MTTETSTVETSTPTPAPKEITSPDLSFSDYEKIRRGEVVSESAPSAPAAKAPVQKEASESETEGHEEHEGTDASDNSEETKDHKEESLEEKPKKQSGFERRVKKLNSKITEAQQERDYWKQEALKVATTPKSEKPDPKPIAESEPDPEKYETHAAFVKAVAFHAAKQVQNEATQNLEKSKIESERAKVVDTYKERRAAFAAKTPDFEEVLADADGVTVSAAVQEAIISSELGPELSYELAKNPEELERISKLSPFIAAREIGKLEARLASKASLETKEPKKLTKAPNPLEPISGGQTTAGKKTPEEMSFSEYERYRRDQMKRKNA